MKLNSSFFPCFIRKKGHLLYPCALPVLQYHLCVMTILVQTEFRGGLMPVGKSLFFTKSISIHPIWPKLFMSAQPDVILNGKRAVCHLYSSNQTKFKKSGYVFCFIFYYLWTLKRGEKLDSKAGWIGGCLSADTRDSGMWLKVASVK